MTELEAIKHLQQKFKKLTRQEIKLRLIRAAKDPIYQKIQLLEKLGSSQDEVNEHIMQLVVTYMQLPRDAPQLQ